MFVSAEGSPSSCLSFVVKPSVPKDLHFQWRQEALTVTCPELPHSELLYEVQYRSLFDNEWQVSGGGVLSGPGWPRRRPDVGEGIARVTGGPGERQASGEQPGHGSVGRSVGRSKSPPPGAMPPVLVTLPLIRRGPPVLWTESK